MTDLAYLGVADIGDLYRRRALTPMDLVAHLLRRIDRLNPQCHAFLAVYAEEAMDAARQCHLDMIAGCWRGPLHGIPYAVKDNIDVAGKPTTCHSRVLAGAPAAGDAAVVRRLRQAGAILLGKTALHEFAVSQPTRELPFPPALNPWKLTLHPGGSSSGSGAAVAAGLVPLAIGTDTGGSVRNPATSCGVVGMKPTYGAVSRQGVFPLSFSLDHVGPITRTAQDNALALAAMAAAAPGDAGSVAHPLPAFGPASLDIRGMRGGVDENVCGASEADPEMLLAFDNAVKTLSSLGAVVRTARLRDLPDWAACGRVIQQCEQYVIHKPWLKTVPQRYCESARGKLLSGAFITAADYIRMLQVRRQLCMEFSDTMKDFDVLVTLSSFTTPCAIDDVDAIGRTYEKQARMPFNLTGTPAMAVPTGFSRGHLPLGMQVVGAAFNERAVYQLAAAYGETCAWQLRHPPEAQGQLAATGTATATATATARHDLGGAFHA